MNDSAESPVRIRREPPPFRPVEVDSIEQLNPYMARVTLHGRSLAGLEIDEPAASVRLLIPSTGTDDLVIPEWNGNEFLLPDGERPIIRTFTPLRLDTIGLRLDLEIVLHEGGATSEWVRRAGPGDPAAVSGPGRGYAVDSSASDFLLAGDQTALPAIGQLIERVPRDAAVHVIVELVHADARVGLPSHPLRSVEWVVLPAGEPPGAALLPALRAHQAVPGTKVWVAGEAGALHGIRKLLYEELGFDRSDVTARGYWKQRG